VPGSPAPALALRDTAGRMLSLVEFKGRTVVLEWTNPGCPVAVASAPPDGCSVKYR
jgi:hypothetical protein